MTDPANRVTLLVNPPAPKAPGPIGPAVAKAKRPKPSEPGNARGQAHRVLSIQHADPLARQLCPAADHRQDDRLYRQNRRELLLEFSPITFSRRLLIDSLAFDLVQLARCGRIIEQAHQPAGLPPGDQPLLAKIRTLSSMVGLANCVLKAFDAGQDWTLPTGHARRLAPYVAVTLQILAKRIKEDKNPDPDLTLTDYGKEIRQRSEGMLATVGPKWWRQFCHLETAARVLAGQQPVKKPDRPRFRAVMNYIRTDTEELIKDVTYDHNKALARVRTASAAMLGKWASNPQALLLLERHRAQLEKSIERKLAQLRES